MPRKRVATEAQKAQTKKEQARKAPPGLHSVVSGFSLAELARMRQAAIDEACGVVLAIADKKRGKPGESEEYLGVFETPIGPRHLYLRPPNPTMFRIFIEQGLGRPASRPAQKFDPVIRVLTAVPGYEERQKAEALEGLPPMGLDVAADPLAVSEDLLR